MTPNNCLNCDTALAHSDKFCRECGQTTHTHRLSLGHLSHEVVHFFTHADKGIFFLIWQLIIAPGKVVREYVAGKRKKYFSPLNFFLIVLGLYVIAFTKLQPLQAGGAKTSAYIETLERKPPTLENLQRLAIAKRQVKASVFMAKYSNFVNMAFTPVVALIMYLGFIKRKFNYTEHLIANLYASGMNALVFSLIIAPITLIMKKGSYFYFMLVIGFLTWEAVYRAIIYYGWMQRPGFWKFCYPLLVSLLVSFAWYQFSTKMIGWYIRTGFNF